VNFDTECWNFLPPGHNEETGMCYHEDNPNESKERCYGYRGCGDFELGPPVQGDRYLCDSCREAKKENRPKKADQEEWEGWRAEQLKKRARKATRLQVAE
jgi:hypothetical protein